MAKRGYKLQEFVAHSANVNCLKIGKKSRRHFITGGDDEKVNLWSVGKPTSLMSLSGHTSPVESVAFDSGEVLVAAGSSAGVIKLWDLEEKKVVRTLNGHRSYCTALEFHPFGEFFASGSMDTNLKIWDIRKKGCIHTYKGHTRGVSTIRFTPDGRWVVSGGLDNVVKVWDLTAGKLLHDFKFHEGHIRSIDFHPFEFLLATGSSDKTVKFWDLETFELIGSTRPESAGVRSISFHPDGRTLFCGLDRSLKVYSWEPVICHDAVDMGWSTLGDLCIHDGKLLGCSYYQNSVGVWVADVSLIEPYGSSSVAEQIVNLEPKSDIQEILGRVESHRRPTSISSDSDTKEIKNIYVDTAGVTSMASEKSVSTPTAVNATEPEEINNLMTQRHVPVVGLHAKNIGQTNNKSFIVPNIVSRDSINGRDSSNPRESIAGGRGINDLSLKAPHRRRPSTGKLDLEGLSVPVESVARSGSDITMSLDSQKRLTTEDAAKDSSKEKVPVMNSVEEKFEKGPSPRAPPNLGNCNGSFDPSKETKPVKYVNGVAVVHGRTRSLVEKFEKREKLNINESQTPDMAAHSSPDTAKTYVVLVEQTPDTAVHRAPGIAKTPAILVPDLAAHIASEAKPSSLLVKTPNTIPKIVADKAKTSPLPVVQTHEVVEAKSSRMQLKEPNTIPNIIPEKPKTPPSPIVQTHVALEAKTSRLPVKATDRVRSIIPERVKASPLSVIQTPNMIPMRIPEKAKTSPMLVARATNASRHVIPANAKSSPVLDDNPQTSGRGLMSANDDKVLEDLMLNHDAILSTLRSRLTKLQVVRHFWERNDMKGAINALRKLPDHSVQADIVSVLMEKMDTLTLDLFSCLLPLLVGLLDSKTERHINLSLEMLLKLVAVFGPVVHSTISAPPAVGVDLHAEKRRECCNQCFVQLQKIQDTLPTIIRRGGLPAKCALELNLVLQQS